MKQGNNEKTNTKNQPQLRHYTKLQNPGLVAFYNIRQGNRVDLFLQLCRLHDWDLLVTTEHELVPAEVRASLQKAGQTHSEKIHKRWVQQYNVERADKLECDRPKN